MKLKKLVLILATIWMMVSGENVSAQASNKKQSGKKPPNILVIMSDDVGIWNISAYHRGMMGAARQISTGSPMKARCSRTITHSNPAQPDELRLFLVSHLSAPAY